MISRFGRIYSSSTLTWYNEQTLTTNVGFVAINETLFALKIPNYTAWIKLFFISWVYFILNVEFPVLGNMNGNLQLLCE